MTIAGKRYYGENVADAEEARRVRFIIREMLEYSGNTNLGDLLPFLQWFDFQGLEKRFANLMKKLDEFMQELVDDCRRRRTAASGRNSENTMIDHLLALQESEGDYYTDEIIKGIILVSKKIKMLRLGYLGRCRLYFTLFCLFCFNIMIYLIKVKS